MSTLRCDLFRSWSEDVEDNECVAVIWHIGGCINGCHQPFTIVEEIEGTEIEVRQAVKDQYPDIEYRPIPRVIKGGLFE